MHVDKAWRDELPTRVELLDPAAADLSNGADLPVQEGHIALEALAPAPVDDRAATNHSVIGRFSHVDLLINQVCEPYSHFHPNTREMRM